MHASLKRLSTFSLPLAAAAGILGLTASAGLAQANYNGGCGGNGMSYSTSNYPYYYNNGNNYNGYLTGTTYNYPTTSYPYWNNNNVYYTTSSQNGTTYNTYTYYLQGYRQGYRLGVEAAIFQRNFGWNGNWNGNTSTNNPAASYYQGLTAGYNAGYSASISGNAGAGGLGY